MSSPSDCLSIARSPKTWWEFIKRNTSGSINPTCDKRSKEQGVKPVVEFGWFRNLDDLVLNALRRFLESHCGELMEDFICIGNKVRYFQTRILRPCSVQVFADWADKKIKSA